MNAQQHSAPWWYRVAARIVPSRCREIPEAANPTWPDGSPRIVLRQVALLSRRCYLQQFGCSEDPQFMHSHPARRMLVLGLWGRYTEHRIAGEPIERRAPYFYTMDASHVHHVQNPGPGHTSIFLMLGLRHDHPVGDKRYYGAPAQWDPRQVAANGRPFRPITRFQSWHAHIQQLVERI